ncbi:MAG TPA: hypothetical protein VM262_00635 [Acidimicrobiales bacterium]|nr:hypothetical protein [Acidimicrobiales bacterium]
MKKLIVSGLVAASLLGGAGVAIAGPYDNGPGPGPGNSGDAAMYGLCKAYANNADEAKENSPVFNEYTEDEWADLCENVRPGGSRRP